MSNCFLAAAGEGGFWAASPLLPAIIAGQLYLVFLIVLGFSVPRLPERLATHFNFRGRPDGWMSRTSYLIFMGVFSLVFSLFPVVLSLWTGASPKSISLPNRAYWLSPEHLAGTQAYLLRHSVWLSALIIVFLIGLHFLVVSANRREPPKLSMGRTLMVVGCFTALVLFWANCLTRHFSQVPRKSPAAVSVSADQQHRATLPYGVERPKVASRFNSP